MSLILATQTPKKKSPGKDLARSEMSKPLTHITRTHIVFLADGKTEALTIHERTPAFERDGNQRTHTITFPSRRQDDATPATCLEYAKAWADAADWIKRRQGLPDKGPPWCCQCGGLTDLCGCGRRQKNINRGEM